MFFDTFKALCQKKGVSCKRAAEDMGLSNSITTKWKKTGATPGGDTLEKIAAYFNVSIEYLLRGTEPVHQQDVLDEVDIAFYNHFKELDEEQKETVRDMVRVMRERRSKKQEK